jgi:hypothetical protein
MSPDIPSRRLPLPTRAPTAARWRLEDRPRDTERAVAPTHITADSGAGLFGRAHQSSISTIDHFDAMR